MRYLGQFFPLAAALTLLAYAPQAKADVPIEDFEDVSDWHGLDLESTLVHQGQHAGRWDDHLTQKSISRSFSTPLDLSSERQLQLWLYSASPTGADIELVLDSDNPADDAGWDYYSKRLHIDWTGWKLLVIRKQDFSVARNPVGWNAIKAISLSADGWGHSPVPNTVLILDDLSFTQGVISNIAVRPHWQGSDFVFDYQVDLEERTGHSRNLSLTIEPPPSFPFTPSLSTPSVSLASHGSAQVQASITVPASVITPARYLELASANLVVSDSGNTADLASLQAAIPLPAREHPRTLLDASDFTRIQSWTSQSPWAQSARDGIVSAADNFPQSFATKYGVSSWAIPSEGGQWGLYYVCPTHGVRLVYSPPMTHTCPVDSEHLTGWPYDQVIYGWMHGDLAERAKDLGLAYQLTGDSAHAQKAADILRAYADAYHSYPLHDIQNKEAASGGRVLAQTLDEANWLIPIAWAYDLIADSTALSDSDRQHIESDLLRAAVQVIQRNQAGMSNWQSWHNAAIGAVGYALQDPVLISQALRDPSNGFDYQMSKSVSSDGFWYEGSWGYHFYALNALLELAEMSSRAGLSPYASPQLQSMFSAPVLFAMPDQSLPPFNDSGSLNLLSSDWYFEVAWNRYHDPRLATILGRTTRRREALFWGAEQLPSPTQGELSSLLFPDAGYAVLRSGSSPNTTYLALDFGPHGGWHGHYDKLGFVLFARDAVLGVDPGTQSYAAPTHTSWDKTTIAHNTVVVDGKNQAEATGELLGFVALPALSMAAANAGPAYPSAALTRLMLVTPDYVLDRFAVQSQDGASHDIDWILHSPGDIHSDLTLSPYSGLPASDGYEHLSQPSAAQLDTDWEVRFAEQTEGGSYGSVWADKPEVKGTFEFSNDQAASGSWSAKLSYDFSQSAGYILYSTPNLEPFGQAPTSLKASIYGDGSGHKIALRLYDATDERFVFPAGTVDFTGWKTFQADAPESWSHYLGNNDGKLDLPIKRVAIELTDVPPGQATGALYVDNIVLTRGSSEQVVSDFELQARALRLRMLAQSDTTVVTGEGLGPDLLVPVPFAMARRHADQTQFTSLLEPYGDQPQITSFSALDTSAPAASNPLAVEMKSAEWRDRLLALSSTSAAQAHTFGPESCDGTLCLLRTSPEGALLRLALASASTLSSDGKLVCQSGAPLDSVQMDWLQSGAQLDIVLSVALSTTLRVLGPSVQHVSVNGVDTAFTREGEYVLLNVSATPSGDGGLGDGSAPETDSGPQDGAIDNPSSGNSDDSGCSCRQARFASNTHGWELAALAGLLLLGRRRKSSR